MIPPNLREFVIWLIEVWCRVSSVGACQRASIVVGMILYPTLDIV